MRKKKKETIDFKIFIRNVQIYQFFDTRGSKKMVLTLTPTIMKYIRP